MVTYTVFFALLAVSSAFPKSEPRTLFVHPKARETFGLEIVNGQPATPHQFPYQVGMYVSTPSYTDFCGGSLISNNYVLTAAHCVDNAVSVNLVFGAHNVTDAGESTQVRLTATQFIIHEKWDSKLLVNDIALIRLPSSIKETNEIKIISLAKGSDSYSNQDGYVAGWGMTKMSQRGITQILQFIKTPILSNDDCKKIDQDYAAIVRDSLLCLSSGSAKVSTCLGDSGGPLAVKGVQVGVVSFGASNCESAKPSVFTRLTEYKDWIVKNSDVKF